MGSPAHVDQVAQLQAFVIANSVVDRLESAPALIPPLHNIDGDGHCDEYPLIYLALAWVGAELYAVAAGDNPLEAIGQLACSKLFSGRPCPNCGQVMVFYDESSPLFTYDPDRNDPLREYVCPIFYDHHQSIYRRACEKPDEAL